MKTEKEVIADISADIRDDIIMARNLLTDAIECTSKPSVDYQKCWRKLSAACYRVSNAESAVYYKAIMEMV